MTNAFARFALLLTILAAACGRGPATHTAHLPSVRTDARAYLDVPLQQSGARTVGDLLQRHPHRFDLSPRGGREGDSAAPRNQLHREPVVIVDGVRVNPSLVWQLPLGEVSSVRVFRGAQAPAAYAAQAGSGVIIIETRNRLP
jgi:outer membrane cobalamin receptor